MSDSLKVHLKDAVKVQDDFQPIGCVDIETPDGVIHFHEAGRSLVSSLENDLGQSPIAIFQYMPERKFGLFAQYSARTAREIAAALLQAANMVDPTGKH